VVVWAADPATTSCSPACNALEKKATKFFLPFEKLVPRYAALFGQLVPLYSSWLRAVGAKLPPEMFRDDDDGKLPAFDAFRKWGRSSPRA
jgi:hypothetical protein